MVPKQSQASRESLWLLILLLLAAVGSGALIVGVAIQTMLRFLAALAQA